MKPPGEMQQMKLDRIVELKQIRRALSKQLEEIDRDEASTKKIDTDITYAVLYVGIPKISTSDIKKQIECVDLQISILIAGL